MYTSCCFAYWPLGGRSVSYINHSDMQQPLTFSVQEILFQSLWITHVQHTMTISQILFTFKDFIFSFCMFLNYDLVMWLCFILTSVVTDGGICPVEVHLFNTSQTPVTKVEWITNEQNEACSLLHRSVLLTSGLQLEPHSATCGPLLLQAPAGQVSLHTPTHAAGCWVLGAVSRGHWWSVTAGVEDPTGDSPSLESREHMQMPEQRATTENTHVRNELLSQIISFIRDQEFFVFFSSSLM